MLMGHRDTVFPKGEPTRRPFRIEGGRAYGPGVADMKAGLVMNAFVLAAFKKFGGAPAPLVGAVHRRRGDRLAVVAADDRARGAARPRGVQLRARPAERQRGQRPQGRRVHALRDHRQGRAFGRQVREGISAIERARAQDHRAARDHRPEARHHGERRPGLGRPDRQHRGALGEGRDRPALRHAGRPRGRDGARSREIIDSATVPGTSAKLAIAGEFLPLVQTPEGKKLFDALRGLRRRCSACRSRASSPAAAPISGSPPGSARRPSARRPGRRHAHTPAGISRGDSLVPRAQTLALAILRDGRGLIPPEPDTASDPKADIRRCGSMSAFKSAAPPVQVDISTLDEQPSANLDIGRRQFVQVQRVRRLLHAGTLT